METVLEKIKELATQAHGEQRRKYTPDLYIVHPIRVMELCRKYTQDTAQLAAALLHDVLEDTEVNQDQLMNLLSGIISDEVAGRTIKLVVELTDVYVKKDYPHLNRRQRKSKEMERMEKISADAQTVKYADIIDNCLEIADHDRSFAPLFLKECKSLLNVMNKGDKQLYHEAERIVEESLRKVGKPR